MHRRKDYYGEDADEFRPERWETLRPGWEYISLILAIFDRFANRDYLGTYRSTEDLVSV